MKPGLSDFAFIETFAMRDKLGVVHILSIWPIREQNWRSVCVFGTVNIAPDGPFLLQRDTNILFIDVVERLLIQLVCALHLKIGKTAVFARTDSKERDGSCQFV